MNKSCSENEKFDLESNLIHNIYFFSVETLSLLGVMVAIAALALFYKIVTVPIGEGYPLLFIFLFMFSSYFVYFCYINATKRYEVGKPKMPETN